MGKKLHKSKSNFTLKRLHQSGNYGNIYERDYLTITKGSTSPEGLISVYNPISFKYYISIGYNGTKIYNYGEWLTNASCGGTNWTTNCMPKTVSDANKIIIKSNSKKLTDFVCYSSASELIRTSLDNIISNFPGELYVTENDLKNDIKSMPDEIKNSELYNFANNGVFFIVKNPMNIDITQISIPEKNILSEIRYFCKSFLKYQIIDDNDKTYDVINWEVIERQDNIQNECLTNGLFLGIVKLTGKDVDSDETILISLYVFFYEGEMLIISENKNYHIRPNQNVIDNFFNKLDDFQKILLNRDTNYSAIFETYIEDEENGWYTSKETYTWPLDKGGWNLLINGPEYTTYIDSLSDLAIGYDENFTDAIWRTMTHEAIGNMDLTFSQNGDFFENIYSSKVKKVLNIIGRQFDNIKRYADNIKTTNNISYTQENNLPDYFLTDNLDLNGWETKNILNYISNDVITEPLYDFGVSSFTASDANSEFLRRLRLNTKNIFLKKGTKQGIEDLLGIFGFHSVNWVESYYALTETKTEYYRNAYELREYVYDVEPYIVDETTLNNIQNINSLKNNFEDVNEGLDEQNPYDGLLITDAIIDDKNYIIPWFDKELNYDGNVYFQMKGGWMKDIKTNNNYDYTVSNIYSYDTQDSILESGKFPGYYYYIKSEDKCYLCKDDYTFEVFPKKNTLEVNRLPENKQENISYLIYNKKYYYWTETPSDATIQNTELISKEETLNTYIEGKEYVILKDVYYKWDGEKYSKYGTYIEMDNIPTDVYLTDGNLNDLKNKFIDNNKGNNPHSGYYDDGGTYIKPYRQWFVNSSFATKNMPSTDNLGFNMELKESDKCMVVNDDNILESLYTLNCKRFKIVFDLYYEKFIREDVLPYLKQVIPSTTIIEFDFDNLNKPRKITFESRGVQDDTNTDLFNSYPPIYETEELNIKINNTHTETYYYKSNMTWEDWVNNSDYNTSSKYNIDNTGKVYYNGDITTNSGEKYVKYLILKNDGSSLETKYCNASDLITLHEEYIIE